MWWSKSDVSYETAWRALWQDLDKLIEAHTPLPVIKCLDITRAALEHPFTIDLNDEQQRAQLAKDLKSSLQPLNLDHIDLNTLLAWFASVHLPDRATIEDIGYLPDEIAPPPNEPRGLWDALNTHLHDADQTGKAAATILYLLARARAVREYQG